MLWLTEYGIPLDVPCPCILNLFGNCNAMISVIISTAFIIKPIVEADTGTVISLLKLAGIT